MINVTVEFEIAPKQLAKFLSLISSFSKTCLTQQGCVGHSHIQNGNRITMSEQFASDNDYQRHRVSDYHIKFKQQSADCIINKTVSINENQSGHEVG